MANPLIDRILPSESADRSQVIEFDGKIGDFPRLAEIVERDLEGLDASQRPGEWRQAPVAIRLEFGWVDIADDLPAVTGRAVAGMTLVCQRCLEAFRLPVEAEFRLVFVAGDELPGSAAGFDSWTLDVDTVRPLDFVEEALVMALPLAPVHASSGACGPVAARIGADEPGKVRPFADLRSQMEGLKKQ